MLAQDKWPFVQVLIVAWILMVVWILMVAWIRVQKGPLNVLSHSCMFPLRSAGKGSVPGLRTTPAAAGPDMVRSNACVLEDVHVHVHEAESVYVYYFPKLLRLRLLYIFLSL